MLDPTDEPHIIIDSNRIVFVPEELRKIAVQYDHKVETVTFDCPRYWDGLDMSTMRVYINYMRSDGKVGMSIPKNVSVDSVDDHIMHFDWTITRGATMAAGVLSFNVCVRKPTVDGGEENHWNSEVNTQMRVAPGLEYEEQKNPQHTDLISDLIDRMEEIQLTVESAGIYINIQQMNTLLAEFESIKEELSKRTETLVFNSTIESIKWSTGSAPYTNTVVIPGIKADDTPHATPIYSSDKSIAIAQEEAWNMISYGTAVVDGITFTCLDSCPNLDIPIQIECFRTWKE
jgi:hypothetical protein